MAVNTWQVACLSLERAIKSKVSGTDGPEIRWNRKARPAQQRTADPCAAISGHGASQARQAWKGDRTRAGRRGRTMVAARPGWQLKETR
jgi:hypothetical protein